MNLRQASLTLVLRFCIFILILLFENIIATKLMNVLNSEALSYLISYIVTLLVLFIVYRKKLIKCLKNIKNIKKNDMKKVLIMYIIFISLMHISSLICERITGSIATNESSIRALINKEPLLMGLSVVIFAPMTEELIFRLNFESEDINKYVSYIFSSILFGLFHVLTSSSIIGLIYIIPYSMMGFAFGIGTCKTNNIFVSIILHIIHNFTTIVLLFM